MMLPKRLLAFAALTIGAGAGHAQQPDKLPPQFTNAPADIQSIVRRQMKGEKVSKSDSMKVVIFARQAAVAGTGVSSPEIQRLMNKAMTGQPLSAEERGKIAGAMMAQRGLPGKIPTTPPSKTQLDSMRAQGFAQGRALAARADSLVSPCPKFAVDSSPFSPATTKAQLLSALRSIEASYATKVGSSVASRLQSRSTNAAGVGLWLVGQVKPSVLVLARAAIASPTPRTLNNLGAALSADGDYRDARLVLDAANRAAPGAPAVLANLGIAYAGLGQSRSAERQLRSAIDAQPELAQARFDLATILKCGSGGGGGGGGASSAITEAQQGQSDWFDDAEDRDVRLMRAEAGLPVSGPKAESEYTPKRPRLMTLGEPRPAGSPGGEVSKPIMPGSIEEYSQLYQAGKYTSESEQLSAHAQVYHAEGARLRAEYAHARQRWMAGATPSNPRMPLSHNAALIGLARRRSRMYYDVAQSTVMMEQDYASAGQRLSDAWKRVPAGDHPCPTIGPAARDAYAVARGAVSAHADRVARIMEDYADDARAWMGEMNDPALIAASLNDVAGDADAAGGLLMADAANVGGQSFIDWVLTCSGYKPGHDDAKTKPAALKKQDPCPLPDLPAIDFGIVSLKIGCEGAEISIDAGIAIEAKLDAKTRSGTLFVGGGLKVPTGWDEPVTFAGQQATRLAGKVSAGGKAGMVFKFDGEGLTDAGFEFGMSASDGKNEKNYQTDLTLVGGLQLSKDMTRPLDGLASAMWDPPPAGGAKR